MFEIGGKFRGKKILDMIHLSNGWLLLKTEDSKSPKDFKVKTVYQLSPTVRSFTPKHAHFAIDLYGKFCYDRDKARSMLNSIIEVWKGKPVEQVIRQYETTTRDLPGYSLEYTLYALNWILDQEDVNFRGRSAEKQKELDDLLRKAGVTTLAHRLGSELAISLMCNIALGVHPVEAFIKANLDVLPIKKGKGSK